MNRYLLVTVGVILAYSGALLLWQLGAQPSPNGCYTFPFGFGALASVYQGSCTYNSVPNYYAGDTGMTAIILGFLVVVWGLTRGRRR